MTFFGEKRWEKGVHPHESPKVMTIPLIVLAALSVVGGVMLLGDWIVEFLAPVVGEAEHHELAVAPWVLTVIITSVVAVGVALAWFLVGKPEVPRVAPAKVSVFTRAARADLYGDAVNEALFMRPGDRFVGGLTTFDDGGVDGAVNGTAATFAGMSGKLRRWQTGYVRSYALSLLAGTVLVLGMLLAVNLS
jgi:NADH-quinone oxidoreductase subunit L